MRRLLQLDLLNIITHSERYRLNWHFFLTWLSVAILIEALVWARVGGKYTRYEKEAILHHLPFNLGLASSRSFGDIEGAVRAWNIETMRAKD